MFGFVFGVAAVGAGASVVQACAMSLLVFTGASQFSAVGVVAAGGSTASALGGALLLAARNGVYGLAMARRLPGPLGQRLIAAQLTIDESTAMSAAQAIPTRSAPPSGSPGVSVYIFWNTGHAARCVGRHGDRPDHVRSGCRASRRRSWRCCGRCCATGAAASPPLLAR